MDKFTVDANAYKKPQILHNIIWAILLALTENDSMYYLFIK